MKKILFLMFIFFTTAFSAEKTGTPIFENLIEYYIEGQPFTGNLEYYNNDLLIEKAQYKDGVIDGKYIKYDKNSQIIAEIIFEKGNLVSGTSIESFDHFYKKVISYENGKKFEKIYKNNILNKEMEYKFSFEKEKNTSPKENFKFYTMELITDGVFKEYYYGKVKLEGSYKDGLLQGEYKQYFNNGNIKTKGFYKNGKPTGVFKTYFITGELSQEKIFDKEKIVGKIKEYFITGELYSEGSIFAGEKVGIYKIYTIHGDRLEKVNYPDGEWLFKKDEPHDFYAGKHNSVSEKTNGEHHLYYGNGQLKQIITYNKGVKVGTSVVYNRIGEEEETINYDELTANKENEEEKESFKSFLKTCLYIAGFIAVIFVVGKTTAKEFDLPQEERSFDWNILTILLISSFIGVFILKNTFSIYRRSFDSDITGLIVSILTFIAIIWHFRNDKKYKVNHFINFIILTTIMGLFLFLVGSAIASYIITGMHRTHFESEIISILTKVVIVLNIIGSITSASVYQTMKKESYLEFKEAEKKV